MRLWIAGLVVASIAMTMTGCMSTAKLRSLTTTVTAQPANSTQTEQLNSVESSPSSPQPENDNAITAITMDEFDELDNFDIPAATAVSTLHPQAPTMAQIESLWHNLLRYAKNAAATGQLFQANLSDDAEDIIDYLISQDHSARTQQEQAILFIALLEHTIVEYEFQRETHHNLNDEAPTAPTKQSRITTSTDQPADEEEKEEDDAEITRLSPEEVLNFLAEEYHIDVVHELTTNPLLYHPAIYHLSLNVMIYVQAPEDLLATVVDHIKVPAQAWAQLHHSINQFKQPPDSVPTQTPELNNQELVDHSDADQNSSPASRQYSVGEFSEGDRIIAAAKQLHSQQLFKAALAQLAEIQSPSPHYNQAQILSQRYSDDAVNQLRGEAAKLYQAQLKTKSIQTKIEYLRDSEQKLLTALREYPESKWIPKVRNNLAVIQQKLDDLTQLTTES